jgi:hypothetical protein
MKPNSKALIPLKLFTFVAAFLLFMLVCIFLSLYLTSRRAAGQYYVTNDCAKISPDGQVTYRAILRKEAGDQHKTVWEFDETLRSPHPEPTKAMNGITVEVMPVSVKNIKRNSLVVWPIYFDPFDCHIFPDSAAPCIWWNGPAGQVDWYEGASRMREASLGSTGPAVKAPARPEDKFDILQSNQNAGLQCPTIVTPRGIYVLNLTTLTIPRISAKLVYNGSCEAFGQIGLSPQVQGANAKQNLLLVVHGNMLSVLDRWGTLLQDIKLPEIVPALLKDHSASFTLFDNGKVSISISSELLDKGIISISTKPSNKRSILLLAEDGSLLRQVDYDTNEITKAMNGGVEWNSSIQFPTLMPPIPVIGRMEKSALIQSIALSLALAAVILWHQTRLGRRGARRMMWVVFTFVFGLLGFVTYLVAYWDRRSEPCPNCRRRCLVAEEICPHCGDPWPAPKPLGIEIIEPV